jgi:hypothetical protein
MKLGGYEAGKLGGDKAGRLRWYDGKRKKD